MLYKSVTLGNYEGDYDENEEAKHIKEVSQNERKINEYDCIGRNNTEFFSIIAPDFLLG